MVLAIKRYGLDLDRAAHVAAPNKSAAWFWFIANRVIGTLQPTVSLAVMLFVSQVPIQSAWIGYLVLIIDLPMTWWGFVVFKNRFFPHIGS